jgi:cytochrome c
MRALLGWAVLVGVLVAACTSVPVVRPPAATVGDPELGQQALVDYGCVACHTIPGVRGANATVGPPLTSFSERAYIAGSLVNSQENLVRWITDPQEVEPGTAMPDVGVRPIDAANMAAYLLSLR